MSEIELTKFTEDLAEKIVKTEYRSRRANYAYVFIQALELNEDDLAVIRGAIKERILTGSFPDLETIWQQYFSEVTGEG